MIHPTKAQTLGICLITAGIIGFLPLQYIRMQKEHALANASTINVPAIAPAPAPQVMSGHPERLVIPSLKLDLSVLEGSYNNKTGEWTLSGKSAHYALPTTLPNDTSGNTLIYGHYNKYVFSRLHTVDLGEEARVYTQEGLVFVYRFIGTEIVDPADTSVFMYQGPSRLTLQTCTGALMQNRQMHYFAFDHVEKI
jgi:LPXTG-site transpeptidase (sortase) family protein